MFQDLRFFLTPKRATKTQPSDVGVSSQSHKLKSENDDIEIEVKRLPGKKEKVEGAAEKTGEAVGKGLKEGATIAKRAGHGLKKELKKKD